MTLLKSIILIFCIMGTTVFINACTSIHSAPGEGFGGEGSGGGGHGR